MKFYLAPLEGVTNFYFRRNFNRHYNSCDKYFIPFIDPKEKSLHQKEKKDIDVKNNLVDKKVVPQLISKNPESSVWLINELNKMGYDEVNLNFGCPSPTVTSKGKGSGMLKDLDYMDKYLDYLFKNTNSKISIKMRVGFDDDTKFFDAIKIINKYPVSELIIHPRTGLEKYSGKLHLNLLDNLDKLTNIDIIYNGEIQTKEDIDYIEKRFPYIKGIMIGRGLISRPDMLSNIPEDKRVEKLKEYFYDLAEENIRLFGWGNSIFFQKQIWFYMINYFEVDKKLFKSLFKETNHDKFNFYVEEVFKCPIKKEIPGLKDFI